MPLELYPNEITPQPSWKRGILANDIIARCSGALIGRRIDGKRQDLVDSSLGEDLEQLSEKALPIQRIPNLSTSLLGGCFLIEYFKFKTKSAGSYPWTEGSRIEEFLTEQNYEVMKDYFVVGWELSRLNERYIPYERKFNKEKEYNNFKSSLINNRNDYILLEEWEKLPLNQNKTRCVELTGQIRVNHAPTNLNYWHFVVDQYPLPDENEPIKNVKGWRNALTMSAWDILSKTFVYLSSPNQIPSISSIDELVQK